MSVVDEAKTGTAVPCPYRSGCDSRWLDAVY